MKVLVEANRVALTAELGGMVSVQGNEIREDPVCTEDIMSALDTTLVTLTNDEPSMLNILLTTGALELSLAVMPALLRTRLPCAFAEVVSD